MACARGESRRWRFGRSSSGSTTVRSRGCSWPRRSIAIWPAARRRCWSCATALVMLAVHEGFSGFIMTGEAPDFVAAVDGPVQPRPLLHSAIPGQSPQRFVAHMAREMSYWAGWPSLGAGGARADFPARRCRSLRGVRCLRTLPLGARAHAVDALRHFSAETRVPRTLASLSRYETRKRGLDVTDSSRRILDTGLVVPATDLEAWLARLDATRPARVPRADRPRPRNSWGKERLAEMARTECEELLRDRMSRVGRGRARSPVRAGGAAAARVPGCVARELASVVGIRDGAGDVG